MSRSVQSRITAHVDALLGCDRCALMHKPVVCGPPVVSRVMLIGQAPGVKEPQLGRPFAWTAGKTLFRWFEESCGMNEATFRQRIYMAAVCRCFPGKAVGGGDRVPNPTEIKNCSSWMRAEFEILKPVLIIPVGKLAIQQLMTFGKLTEVIGKQVRDERLGCDVIALPHPSGASTWHRTEPGKSLLAKALHLICTHPAFPQDQ